MTTRIEHDSMGEIAVPADKYYGAQTERSRLNFPFSIEERMPEEIIRAFGLLKAAAAEANSICVPQKMTEEKKKYLLLAANEVATGKLSEHFPLSIFQTGSGTQTNMNANEVISNRANELANKKLLHPNDDVNMSQSSNDTFPAAMHISAVLIIENKLLPALDKLIDEFQILENQYADTLKCGRTHLQDAVPMTFGQEVSGWRTSLIKDKELILLSLSPLRELALGGTAVGTGLNAPKDFARLVAEKLTKSTKTNFITASNKFHALTSKDELVFAHGALKSLSVDLIKIANDIRFLSSGPRTGLGEIFIPENEPGSSIMPGKVNPTQCESIIMVATQVLANDTAISLAASQGNFELNVCMPVCIANFLRSVRLLSCSMDNFRLRCVCGIRANEEKMRENVNKSLMLAAALNPYIGYENAAKTVKLAHVENLTLKEACVKLGFLSADEFDKVFHPETMTGR